jgi:hypothetical protein
MSFCICHRRLALSITPLFYRLKGFLALNIIKLLFVIANIAGLMCDRFVSKYK